MRNLKPLSVFAILFLACLLSCTSIQNEAIPEPKEIEPAALAQAVAPSPHPTQAQAFEAYPAPIEAEIATDYPEPEQVSQIIEEGYPAPPEAAEPSEDLIQIEVIEIFPHNPAVFTQGLIWDDGSFYESGGLYGESALYRVDLETGQANAVTPILPEYFAEGLALVDDRLIMLTWKAGVAIIFDKNSLQEIGRFSYDGQGWGLCYEPTQNQLWMSSGSSLIVSRDPMTFEVTGQIQVSDNGLTIDQINELECVNGIIYANIWKSDIILAIDSQTGNVIHKIDGSSLLSADEQATLVQGSQVLNGIAYDPAEDVFYLTGKQWSQLFKVRFATSE